MGKKDTKTQIAIINLPVHSYYRWIMICVLFVGAALALGGIL